MEKSDVRYRTLRCIKKEQKGWLHKDREVTYKVIGVITVATRPGVTSNGDIIPGSFIAGIAYAKQKHFRRARGQQIAFNRMNTREHVVFPVEGKTLKDVIIDKYIDRTISFVHEADAIV